eukprot:CAMPEP_0194367070 /NCGR_PEP_ID=MMETSP0174-20130528/15173_1 /TAXON_ID=216777 /ORGANISM="Proboscia alata, Strain PI-D3" /LENGTH=350 /DNA_ID=CAMNT_0039142639 /DNA_START=79 /DNA_END=1131 /DNA_ORIENTATION=+
MPSNIIGSIISPPKKKKKPNDFLSYYHRSKLPPADQWKDSPIFVSPSARAQHITYNLPSTNGGDAVLPFPIDGTPVLFHGPFFKGQISQRVRIKNSCNSSSTKDYFRGRSRQFQWSVQGSFSKPLRFDQVVTGQSFERPFRNAPAVSLVKRGLSLLKSRLPETFKCDLDSSTPYFEHSLVSGCQHFRADNANTENEDGLAPLSYINDEGDVIEDTSLVGIGIPKDPEKRKKYFSKRKNLEKYYFQPGLVYTFDFYANFFNPKNHSLELTKFFCIDISPYFNGYPIFLAMARDKETGNYLWATEMWHERLLHIDQKPRMMARILSSSRDDKDNHSEVKGVLVETQVLGEGC